MEELEEPQVSWVFPPVAVWVQEWDVGVVLLKSQLLHLLIRNNLHTWPGTQCSFDLNNMNILVYLLHETTFL